MTAPSAVLWAIPAAIAGFALGWLHFTSLSRVTHLLLAGRMSAVALQLARFALLAGFLFLCAQAGPAALVAGAAGVLAARIWVLRRLR